MPSFARHGSRILGIVNEIEDLRLLPPTWRFAAVAAELCR